MVFNVQLRQWGTVLGTVSGCLWVRVGDALCYWPAGVCRSEGELFGRL